MSYMFETYFGKFFWIIVMCYLHHECKRQRMISLNPLGSHRLDNSTGAFCGVTRLTEGEFSKQKTKSYLLELTWKTPDPTKTDVVVRKIYHEDTIKRTSITAQLHHQCGIG